jgi:hypothetical protein
MRMPLVRFTIRRIMNLVAIIAIALASLRFTAETWSIIVASLTLAGLGVAILGEFRHPRSDMSPQPGRRLARG